MASTHPRILGGLAAGRGDGVRLLACLQFAGLGQAWLGQTGRGPERPIWVVQTRGPQPHWHQGPDSQKTRFSMHDERAGFGMIQVNYIYYAAEDLTGGGALAVL